ncbi:unnamed protein product [Rhizophagus irregularis]|nr:unnamed protein product [Rhizophagus irregularis]
MSTSTPIPVYTPGEPTGPPPAHLANEKDDKKLVGILKAHANLLTTRGRLTVDSEIQEANNQIKHIINILMERCEAKHEELDTTKGLLAFTQDKINAFDETFTNLERQLIIIRAANDNFIEENHNLQRDYDTMVELRRRAIGERNQARHERNVLQADYTQAVRDRNEAQNAVNRGNILLNHWQLRATRTGGQLVLANAQIGQVNAQLAHANNRTIEPFSTSSQQPRTFCDMATVALGLPIFEGREDDDLERFIELYKGYLHSLGINPAAEGGPPTGWEKGMGILRACMKGPAADWYDNNILGRRVKLRFINAQLVHGNEAGFKALAFNAGANVPGNSWVALSGAAVYAGANAAHLVNTVWPDYTLEVNDDIWRLRAGMELTDDQFNYITGPQGGGAIAGGGAGAGHPYVIPLRPCHALMKLRADYPTQQDARRCLHFGNLFQEDSSVRNFYTSVRKNGHLLAFDNQVIRNQFLRGLSPKNVVEVERLGIDRPLDELVNALERVEKSKDEMYRGQQYQDAHRRLKQTKALQSV